MIALVGALVAGVLTTLAPCVLPLLPVIVGGSMTRPGDDPTLSEVGSGGSGVLVSTRPRVRLDSGVGRALLVTASLGVSVLVFTLLLKASTAFLALDPQVWSYVSGGLLVVLGLVGVAPGLWERASSWLALQGRTSAGLAAAQDRGGVVGSVLTGAALGPVFTSCSPMYGYVIVTVLPASPAYGVLLLVAYVLGLCAALLAVALLGQRLIRRLGWAADPHGVFRRVVGLLFLLVGLAVLAGADRELQTWVIEHSPIRPWELDEGFIPQ